MKNLSSYCIFSATYIWCEIIFLIFYLLCALLCVVFSNLSSNTNSCQEKKHAWYIKSSYFSPNFQFPLIIVSHILWGEFWYLLTTINFVKTLVAYWLERMKEWGFGAARSRVQALPHYRNHLNKSKLLVYLQIHFVDNTCPYNLIHPIRIHE